MGEKLQTVKTGDICAECGNDEFFIIDNIEEYVKFCSKCRWSIAISKQEFVDKFEYPDCGSLRGELEENDAKLGVRCLNCGKVHIMLEKQTTINNRKKFLERNNPKCPRCGSTAITTGQRGFKYHWFGGFDWGFFGSNKTVNRCGNCGHTWEPKMK